MPIEFQSTLSRRERLIPMLPKQRKISNFNPRSPEESDGLMQAHREQGARISIHALPKRATSGRKADVERFKNFNPRSPEESDIRSSLNDALIDDFNPRSPEESDDDDSKLAKIIRNFNPRSPEESDCFNSWIDFNNNDFNPRSPEESDGYNAFG